MKIRVPQASPSVLMFLAIALIFGISIWFLRCSKHKDSTRTENNGGNQTGEIGNWGPATHVFNEYNVTFTADGQTMYLGWPIKVSHKTGGTWSIPKELPYPINDSVGSRSMNPSITGDGNTLYFVRNDDRSPYFWYSKKINGTWQEPQPVPVNFNIPDGVSSENVDICISWDGTKLWFSDEQDIYYSEFQGGSWSKPQPFSVINTVDYREFDMAISGDGLVLYFATGGRPGYRAYSIWATRKIKGVWQEPVPLDANINIPAYEEIYCPAITFDGSQFYFGAYDRNGELPSGTLVSNRIR